MVPGPTHSTTSVARPPPCRHRDAPTDTNTDDGLHHPLLVSSILPICPLIPRQKITGVKKAQDGPDHPQPAVLHAAPAPSLAHFGLALLRRRRRKSSSRPPVAASEQRCGRVADCELDLFHRALHDELGVSNANAAAAAAAVPAAENRD